MYGGVTAGAKLCSVGDCDDGQRGKGETTDCHGRQVSDGRFQKQERDRSQDPGPRHDPPEQGFERRVPAKEQRGPAQKQR